MRGIEKKLQLLCDIAEALKLREQDLYHAREFIIYNEFGLSFDTLITQMCEYDIEIDDQIYSLIESIGIELKLSCDKYDFVRELIRKDQKIPTQFAGRLMETISR
jgi:hypothetical protein